MRIEEEEWEMKVVRMFGWRLKLKWELKLILVYELIINQLKEIVVLNKYIVW